MITRNMAEAALWRNGGPHLYVRLERISHVCDQLFFPKVTWHVLLAPLCIWSMKHYYAANMWV